jgi:hypothetical protein
MYLPQLKRALECKYKLGAVNLEAVIQVTCYDWVASLMNLFRKKRAKDRSLKDSNIHHGKED